MPGPAPMEQVEIMSTSHITYSGMAELFVNILFVYTVVIVIAYLCFKSKSKISAATERFFKFLGEKMATALMGLFEDESPFKEADGIDNELDGLRGDAKETMFQMFQAAVRPDATPAQTSDNLHNFDTSGHQHEGSPQDDDDSDWW